MPPKAPSNVAVLTRENQVWASKKKQKKEQVKEILFDDTARREYLTGFRKRKLARQEAGKARAMEKERQARLEERREIRKELKERAVKNAREVERTYGGEYDSGNPGEASTSSQTGPHQEDVQYEDQEQLATVTIVEEFNPDDFRSANTGVRKRETAQEHPRKPDRRKEKALMLSKPSIKKPKFHYETKAARKHEKLKQRARRKDKAEMRTRKGRR
ncbi:hypothetical protein FRB91_006718 [Serendipita sp. 411]|nr:hypothetical protein FRB91_006718 [Serendipita sp. 411]